MPKDKKMWDNILTVIMSLLCLLWIYPIVLILLNSLKMEGTFTTSTVFQLPTAETFAGLSNYIYGVTKMGFLSSLGYSLVITVSSVALILLCCSMTGWYLTRVNNKLSKFMNLLIVFSMVVPFQMVMFTLSKTADTLNLNTPLEHLHHLSGLRCRSGRVHVHRLHEERPHRDRRGCHDRRLQPHPDLLQDRLPHPQAHHDLHCHP